LVAFNWHDGCKYVGMSPGMVSGADKEGNRPMLAQRETLKRMIVGGLGAVLFGATCLIAATGPATAIATQSLPAQSSPQS
jgi:hypothetical protein